MNVRDMMRRSAAIHANKPAIIAGDVRLTFKEAWQRGLRMANALQSFGIKPKDFVGSLEDNTLEAVDFFLAAAILNVTRVPLYARNAVASHEHMLDHTDCKAVVVSEKYADDLFGLEQRLDSLEHVIVRSEADYEQWLASFPDTDPAPEIDVDDGYVLRHTAGTTGKAKGVMLTHRKWMSIGRDWFFPQPPIEVGDVCMHLAPISHASGYQLVPVWIMGGVNLVVDNFTSGSAVELMVKEEAAYCFLAPTMVQDVLQIDAAWNMDFSNLKSLLIGAAPIAVSTLQRAYKLWGDVLCQLYGQTEAVPIMITMAHDWIVDIPGSEPIKSLGKVHPYVDIEIRDVDTREVVPLNTEGEICARVDGQMDGYWRNPEATSETIVDGWVHTNDIGYMDANGYVYMCDRLDDMIISGGFNIWPKELENVVAAHPEVIEVVAIAVTHERFGQSPYLICYVKDATSVTEAELIHMCANELGSYKKPAGVTITTEPLQRTPVGKISRKLIRKSYEDRVFS